MAAHAPLMPMLCGRAPHGPSGFKCMRPVLLASILSLLAIAAGAGQQREEPLADSVRSALSAAVEAQTPPKLVFRDAAHQAEFARWVQALDVRLKRWVSSPLARQDLLQTVWYEAQRAALPPEHVLGLIQVESAFRKFAVSTAGARGLMQVMPFWADHIGDGHTRAMFELQVNVRFGCTILRHYLDLERGDWVMALGRYNGSRGQHAYPRAVLSASEAWRP